MEKIGQNIKINVEALKSQLLTRKTTRERFNLPMSKKQATDSLIAAYQAEVEYRKREFVLDDETRENIEHFANFLVNSGSRFGVMFSGVCGNGKTTLVYAFQTLLNYLRDKGLVDNDAGISVIDAKEVAYYAKDVQRFRQLKDRAMIAIEDMGREPVEVLEYGNVLNPVIDLLEYRYNAQLFTLITTNLVPKEIRGRYGNRIADRFNEMFDKVIFANKTYRK
jgi:DNA replication protein DnaC